MSISTKVTPYGLDFFAELPPRKISAADGISHSPDLEPHSAMILKPNCDRHIIAVVTTEAIIRLYDPITLTCWAQLDGHASRITDVSWCQRVPHILASSSMDGTVRIWDTRKVEARYMQSRSTGEGVTRPLGCIWSWSVLPDVREADTWGVAFGAEDTLLAVACESKVKLFTLEPMMTNMLREGKYCTKAPPIMATYGMHSDVVTCVRFLSAPESSHVLLSGGDDCLVIAYDTSFKAKDPIDVAVSMNGDESDSDDSEDDNDDSILLMIPTENSVSSITVATGSEAGSDCVVLVLTATNQLVGWRCNLRRDCDEARIEKMVNVEQEVGEHPLLKSGDTAGYIVDQFYDHATERLYLLAGSVNGHMLLFHITVGSVGVVATFTDQHSGVIRTGHQGVIRCGIMLPKLQTPSPFEYLADVQSSREDIGTMIITGGEDGRVCRWRPENAIKYDSTQCDANPQESRRKGARSVPY